ncbi:MAG: TonB-dependent receptor, partial [Verrucomicrobiae bacterium]|nr:TonB-dependent receptor [Verrucomicrobiae bacterium]
FNISRSFKLPIGNDIGTATSEFQANADIEPISSMNYEVGFRWGCWKEFSGSLALYHSELRDDIQYNPFAKPWGQNQNFDETRNGIELALQSSPVQWLNLNLNYTLQESRFEGGEYDGNQIPQVPQHIISGGLAWTPVKWFRWSWEAVYARDQVPTNDLRNDFDRNDYFVINTRMSWTPCKHSEVYLAVNNILDTLYETYPAVSSPEWATGKQTRYYNPAPGLTVYGGLSVKF